MDILNRLKMLRTEDFIWITYFFIAAFAIFSNAFERDYVKTNNIFTTIVIHTMHNTLAVIILILAYLAGV